MAALAVSAVIASFTATHPRYPMIVAGVFAALCAVSLGFVHLHPFERFGPANLVTTLRAALVAAIAAFVFEPPLPDIAWTAAAVGVLVAVLDGADGWLARRSGMASAFGARYDMEIDALLILLLAVLAWLHGKAGAWIVLAGAMRYLFVAAGYPWPWMHAPLPPSVRRKSVCVVQIVGLALIMVPLVIPPLSTTVAAVTLATLTWSFAVDVRWLWRHRA